MNDLQRLHKSLLDFDKYRLKPGLAKLVYKEGTQYFDKLTKPRNEITESEIELTKKMNPDRQAVIVIQGANEFLKNQIYRNEKRIFI